MTTTLPRVQVTVTPELSQAMDQARQIWPGRPASQLVASLARAGAAALCDQGDLLTARREAFGAFSGVYPPGYLEELREDWPA